MNPDTFRRAVGVACDIASDVAAGLARTVVAAASTLAVAVMPDETAAGSDPQRTPRIPAAPPPLAPLPQELLDDLAAVEDAPWSGATFSPWQVPDDWRVPDDLADLDGPDGGVSA